MKIQGWVRGGWLLDVAEIRHFRGTPLPTEVLHGRPL